MTAQGKRSPTRLLLRRRFAMLYMTWAMEQPVQGSDGLSGKTSHDLNREGSGSELASEALDDVDEGVHGGAEVDVNVKFFPEGVVEAQAKLCAMSVQCLGQ